MPSRIPLSVEVKHVLKLLMYTLIGLLLTSSAYFFVKTSGTAEKGYKLRENQLRQKTLETENRLLEQRVLNLQSLEELKKSDAIKKMQEPEPPVFVAPPSPLTQKK